MYRADSGPRTGYTLALADAGRVIGVTPTLDAMTGKDESYSVTFDDVDGRTITYSSFAGLPSPEQAMQLIAHGRPTGASSADGHNITLDSSTFGK